MAQSPTPTLLLSGLDSLYVGFSIDGFSIDWEELAYQKERLKLDQEDFAEITLGDRPWAFLPYGAYPYPYQLSSPQFRVKLAERLSPNCHVQIASEGLWTQGLDALEREIRAWFAALGAQETKPETISRADFAYDFHLPQIDFGPEHFATRATKDAQWREHGQVQSFQIGSGDVVVRVYDKVAEIEQQSEKTWLYDLWGHNQEVWRIEFQVRGPRLKKAGIRTLENLRDYRSDLLRELASGHTTLRQPNGDTNRSRWSLHPLWQALQKAIEAEAQTGLVEAIKPENGVEYRLHRQLQSLYGDLKGVTTALAKREGSNEPRSLDDVLARLGDLLDEYHCPILWEQEIRKRLRARELGVQ